MKTGRDAWASLALGLALSLAAHASGKSEYAVGPVPAWVARIQEPVPLGAPHAASSTSRGTRWILSDRQRRIDARTEATYSHTLVQAVDASGVDDATQVDISFDPSYQTLTLHDVRVWRQGQARSQLATLDARVLQREPELASRVYDGRETVSLLLRDVRPGDAVDVEYTLTGSNPVFAEHRFGDMALQAGVPVDHHRRRLLVATAMGVSLRLRHGAPAATETTAGASHDFVWDRRDVAALRPDDRTPGGWDDRASIGYTDFADWGAVVRWALPLYRAPDRLGPGLQAERDRLAAAHATPEARVIGALRLVQEQVRYLGVEMGANSHAPSDPDRVYARRYGDCKEKALLLVALLRSMGIDASPALVDTLRRGDIAEDLPSPDSFNHAVTRIRLGDRTYWLDPTRRPQGGDLDHVAESRFGRALVIAPGVVALERMAPAQLSDDVLEETMSFDFSQGAAAPAPLDIKTVHRGEDAERVRQDIADGGLDELQRNYLAYYADTWKGVTVAAPMTMQDDQVSNALTTIEHYRLPDAWDDAPRHGAIQAEFNPDEVYGWLKRPKRARRISPLELGPPIERVLRMDILLPVARAAWTDRQHVQAPQFTYDRAIDLHERHMRIDYRFRRSMEAVAPGQLDAYADKVDEARQVVGRTLFKPSPRLAWDGGLLLPALLLAWFGWRALRWWWRRQMGAALEARTVAATPSGQPFPAPAEPEATVPGSYASR